ncbi:MAG: (2Fe-2S)-binding protein [Gammaproteobacteria bacterium]|nr:(2Fe-2S)-binding protein [Gammaproteobacteria bacterium]MDH4255401.1 (2Fe-2S)-binding protein [Gammaproteobacteria bacterium]MDH5311366.1 (2Fe-2S)-binding protein [Gammaproteobacteria bacterium]
MVEFRVNGEDVAFDGDADTPLLWILRDHFSLTGTKFGCGTGQCGACTVHVDGAAQRSCLVAAATLDGRSITTIEGLAPDGENLHPVQAAWLEFDVPQCGYCQAGQIMAVVDLLRQVPNPTDADIDARLSNICRCGTYVRIRQAIHRAAELLAAGGDDATR